jgi:HIP---CoA ligase
MTNPSHYQQFQASVRRHGDRIAIRSEGQDITYAELERISRQVAAGLMQLGVERGDRIAIWGVNSAQWIMAALGIQAVGGVLIPIGTRLRGREAAEILEKSGTRIVFCDRTFGDFSYVDALQSAGIAAQGHIITLDDDHGTQGGTMSLSQVRQLAPAPDQAGLDRRIAAGSGSDLADIIFTSGTTGQPKGVPITCAQSLLACQAQQDDIYELTADDVFAVSFPFAHNAGYRAGWQIALLHGVRILPVSVFDPGALLKLIERERVTYLPVVVPVAQGLLDHPDRERTDLSSLKAMSTGGTTIPVKLIEDMQNLIGEGVLVQSGYGMTETAGSISSTRSGDPARVIAMTVGRPLRSLEVRIIDREHRDVAPGEVGEIAVRGPQVAKGYYENPAATAEAFTADGFLLTGDAGSMDDAGNIRITDRIKDMYLTGGFNCYPAEIEKIIRTMPGVGAVAVIGVDDARLGQTGKAFIVRAPGASLDEEQVIAWCRNEMANYKVPRSVVFLDALPVNATGKVAKTELRAIGG